ncbi:MAG TPA: aminotransferase class V-fold PLP-dependent enzyme [Phycisphaerae bacterium]|nr:aminotransferase class V-fold PLP-dependent enzyme [Phycisphaerae bacterium]
MIYLDNNSTTRVIEPVIEAMRRYWGVEFGNPSSLHRMGQNARHAIETAREQVAALINCTPREVVFTSGGTESDNLAILGTLRAHSTKKHVVTTAVEHPAVFSLCEQLQTEGYRVTFIGVDEQGHLDIDRFDSALTPDTAIASVMYANNETGVIFPIEKIVEICHARGVPLHTDAVQAVGKLPVDAKRLGASLMSISAHKIHAPKGVGALYVGKGVRLRSRQVGGHQERDLRPGTENVAAIVGFGEAARLARQRMQEGTNAKIAALRDRLEAGLLAAAPIARVIGDPKSRTANTTSIAFENLEAEAILIALSEEGVCASSGSACSSGSLEPSHVLKAMGIDQRWAHGAIRFSLSFETTQEEIDEALRIVPRVIERLAAIHAPPDYAKNR